jgi:hypothetical protein
MSASSISILDAIADEKLFGRWFEGESWNVWKAVLRAAYCLPMSPTDLALFRSVAGEREPPTRRVKELFAIAGRRGGKDSVASLIAAHAAVFGDYVGRLRPGERASVLCLAVNREQAAIVQRYIASYFCECELLAPLVLREAGEVLELSNNVEIIVSTNSFRSIRGKTIAVAILDEAGFWYDEKFSNPAEEVYAALLPGMVTLPDAMLVTISTPWRASGFLYDKWKQYFGKEENDVLVVHGGSRIFNPSIPAAFIERELARDRVKARSEWEAEWRDDVGSWLARDLIMQAVDDGVVVRAPEPGRHYSGFVDPSGGVNDAFTAAIAHVEGDRAVLDCLYEQPAPFDPEAAVADIVALLRSYRAARVTGDGYAAGWVVEAFGRHQITYETSKLNRSEIYLNAAPLFASGRCRLLDSPRLVSQFLGLERSAVAGGRDKVDHPPNGHDDLCNSAAGALTLVAGPESTAGLFEMWRKLGGSPEPKREIAGIVIQSAPPPPPRPEGLIGAGFGHVFRFKPGGRSA